MANEGKKPEEMESLQPRSSRRGLWIGIAAVVVVVVILAAGLATSWFGLVGSSTPAPQTITLNGQGSTFALPVISAWSTQYKTLTGVQINYQGTGSGAGINNIIAKSDDFGATDAPLNATQHAQNPSLLTIPESLGAVTMAYNVPGVPSHINMTGTIIAGIYLRLITNWNDPSISAVNPGVTFPNLAIIPTHRSDASGTTFCFTNYLTVVNSTWASQIGTAKSVSWPSGEIGAQGNPGVAAVVQGQKGAIGYVELAYSLQNSLAYAQVQNVAGNYILPTLNSTAAAAASASGSLPAGNADWSHVSIVNAAGADSYPIATFTYLLVYQELNVFPSGVMTQARAQALVSFLWWAVHDGQSTAGSLQYVPLPAAVVSGDVTTIQSMTFNGQALST
jgi:phosphate transport system substrate-binding protein